MDNWLRLHPSNVCVVHCLAGKGRTGTSICCYLLLTSLFNDVNKALDYFKYKR